MKIGVFGGTFDPIHLGHIDMINQVVECINLNKIVFVPVYHPPHKEDNKIASYQHRMNMLQLALSKADRYSISDFEGKNSGISYTLHTINHFKETYPKDDIYYIMGSDAFSHIDTWYQWNVLLQSCHLIVVDRAKSSFSIEKNIQDILDKSFYQFIHLKITTLPISSTLIRSFLRNRNYEESKKMLDNDVYAYILANHLYTGDTDAI